MALERLLKGFADFRLGYYREHLDLFDKLATEGQSPRILFIGCSDARVDPGILTQTKPGDIFTVRNVAALVPPAQPDGRHHGTSAAIEFAVRGLSVEHIVVLGHALCGGIAALVDGDKNDAYAHYDYLATWMRVARDVRDVVVDGMAGRPRDEVARAVEQASVLCSVKNLMTFPWLAEKVAAGTLVLHAWWFNLTEGQLYAFDPATARFAPVSGVSLEGAVTARTQLSDLSAERFIAAAGRKPDF